VAPTTQSSWAGKRKPHLYIGICRQVRRGVWMGQTLFIWVLHRTLGCVIRMTCQLDVERNKTLLSKSRNIWVKEIYESCWRYKITLLKTVAYSCNEEAVEAASVWWQANSLVVKQLETGLQGRDQCSQEPNCCKPRQRPAEALQLAASADALAVGGGLGSEQLGARVAWWWSHYPDCWFFKSIFCLICHSSSIVFLVFEVLCLKSLCVREHFWF